MMTDDTAQTITAPTRRRRGRERTRGQSIVEFALVLPIMLIFLLIAADFGRAYTAYLTVSSSAREGAAYASRSESVNVSDVRNRALDELGNDRKIWGETPTITVTTGQTDGQGYPQVSVTVEYKFVPLFRVWPIPSSIDMERTVTMRVIGS